MYTSYPFKRASYSFNSLLQAEELQEHRLNNGRDVTNTLSKVSDELVRVAVDHLGVLRALVNTGASLVRSVGNAKDSRPLLELLITTLRADERIGETVGNQEARALASVSRVRIGDEGCPLFGSVSKTLGAGLVGTKGSGVTLGSSEACEGSTRVGSTGLKDLGV